MSDNDQFLDDLLNGSLAARSNAEPRAGYEARLISAVATATETRQARNWAPVVVALACCAIGTLLVYKSSGARREPLKPSVSKVSPFPVARQLSASGTGRGSDASMREALFAKRDKRKEEMSRRSGAIAGRGQRTSWPAEFPSPSPPSEEEKLLQAYVAASPPEQLLAWQSKPKITKDLVIQGLMIEPLEEETGLAE